jgi:trans-aconitate 2-methyltransferase
MKWDAEVYDSVKSPQTDAGAELIALAGVQADDATLDIGCGTGRLTLELARLAHSGKVVGIDPSAEMLNRAGEVSSAVDTICLMNICAQQMDFTNEFDLIYSNSALQWIKEQEDVIARSYKALKSGGRIALQLPARDFCWAMMENIYSVISALRLDSVYKKMEFPWRFPVKNEMEGFLRDAGFANIKTFYKEYTIVFDSVNDVLDWGVSAGLRPFLAPLSVKKQDWFKYAFAMGFESYRAEKGIEFGFKRLFAFGEKEEKS